MIPIFPRRRARAVVAVALAVSGLTVGCTDVGDSTAVPGSPESGAEDGGVDATTGEQDGATDAPSGEDTGGDAMAAESGAQVQPDATNGEDAGAGVDATAGEQDAPADVAPDAVQDSSGAVDATGDGAGTPEAGAHDSGADAGTDASLVEAGGNEGGADGGLVPCTAPGQVNCFKCDGNTAHAGVCTPTEAILVERDIAKNYIAGGQLSPDSSCYECLFNAGCIDDDKNFDVGQECGDLSGTVGSGAKASETETQACLDTLGCIFAAGCQNAAAQNAAATDGISNCFCGSNELTSTACAGAPTIAAGPASAAPNGACAQVEIDGFGDTTSTSNTSILQSFTTNATGSGMANNIFACAGSNTGTFACPGCF